MLKKISTFIFSVKFHLNLYYLKHSTYHIRNLAVGFIPRAEAEICKYTIFRLPNSNLALWVAIDNFFISGNTEVIWKNSTWFKFSVPKWYVNLFWIKREEISAENVFVCFERFLIKHIYNKIKKILTDYRILRFKNSWGDFKFPFSKCSE